MSRGSTQRPTTVETGAAVDDALKILWVKSGCGLLHPLDTGGKKRTHGMLREISRHHMVDYLAFRAPDEEVTAEEREDSYAANKEWILKSETERGSLPFFFQLATNRFTSSKPFSLQRYEQGEMKRRIREKTTSGGYDFVVCDYLFPALNVLSNTSGVPTVLFQHNTEAQIWERLASNQKSSLARYYFAGQHKRMQSWEERLCKAFDGVITVSEEDAQIARNDYHLSNVLGAVPGGVDCDFFKPDSDEERHPHQIAFLGSMDWMPNVEAVQHFHESILPGLRREYPDVKLLVVGRKPTKALKQLAESDPSITLTGTVDDVRPWIHSCSVLVVPLLSGSGTRIKILEAMAMGIPIVSTSVGAEGLELIPGEHLLIEDDSESFTEQTLRLLRDHSMRQTLSQKARQHVELNHSWARASETFIEHCQSVISGR